ncbi:GMC family oxidoreductase [Gynuella sunshinyii]|uniref:Choline dehydrogenase and related flavoprotein n=1 Tax=Gynuella sunshinyii YC6258 TaxID=1445510 RepID=A0A0C5VHA3_9GAMM|nr:GMC family oxidoreductase N-terminal domain-containing protein [Gynuella sunshinyii]AJQ93626.1 choline dehydrogenase and related flavoprotein [Gynuella sunshinyii YC6258]
MSFDYIIVGGGSAGSVLAARLSEDPGCSVLLLESGGQGNSPLIKIPLGMAVTVPTRIHNWGFQTVPQAALNHRQCYQPRGHALGGSSAINAMIYTRGHPHDYDDWASLGLTDFAWSEVLPWFKHSEGNERLGEPWHGTDGPLSVSDLRYQNPVIDAFIDAARQSGYPINEDFNGNQQLGIGRYQVTQTEGIRCSAARAFLTPCMERKNLTVLTHARVARLVPDNHGIKAVEVILQRGSRQNFSARKEVILCGGTFHSPQLLMLSGIGPKEELDRHRIPVLLEQNQVGANLQDHLDYISVWRSSNSHLVGYGIQGMARMATELPAYIHHRRGLFSSNIADAGGFIKTDPALDRPDIQLHFLLAMADDHNRKLHYGQGFSLHACQLRPYSRGTVGLYDAHPMTAPRIDPAYLSDDRDIDVLLKGIKLSREIVYQSAMDHLRGRSMFLPDHPDDAVLLDSIRQRAESIYHPVGTCRMGVDADAVVDQHFRVKGIEGLRVVDASVMPLLPGGNTNAPTIMLAERAADWIKQES